jgi:hypothetical protein
MVTIRIADHVQYASSYPDGQMIYDLLAPRLALGEEVELSFAGFTAVPSAFVNAALVQLLEVLPMDLIRSNLKITDSTRYINDLIKRRLTFVSSSPQPGPAPARIDPLRA